MFSSILNYTISFLNNVILSYLLWISLHYISVHLYSYFCTPFTLIGFLSSPFIAPLPPSKMMRRVIKDGGRIIEVMWIILGKWIIEKMLLKGLIPKKEE